MQVARWGNSLAVRLPSAVVEALDLKEGDQIEIRIAGKREFRIRGRARPEQGKRPRPPTPAASTSTSWLYVQPGRGQ